MIDYDLHIHSTYSDGVYTPEEIFKAAKEQKLKGLAITDHDTVNGLQEGEMLSQKYEIAFIPGIELSTEYDHREIHLLGYGFDYKNLELGKFLSTIRDERLMRVNKMIDRLRELGYELSFSDLNPSQTQMAEGEGANNVQAIGRPHVARALIDKGYFKSMNEVFSQLLGDGKPAFVDRAKLNTIDGIKWIRQYGGVPVLAHPGLIHVTDQQLTRYMEAFVQNGLMGLEVYHSEHPEYKAYAMTKLARRYQLLVTGGSDFHAPGAHGRNASEHYIGYRGVPQMEADRLTSLIPDLFMKED